MAFEKGKLVRWVDDKGFGFIKPENGGADIFIHISTLKSMSRPPVVGDIINYETGFDDKGKIRAITARIDGVPEVLTLAPIYRKPKPEKSSYPASRPVRSHNAYRQPNKKTGFWIVPVLLIVAVASVYSKYANHNDSSTVITNIEPIKPAQNFQCQGKVYCSEMSSYDEAVFYLQNCSGTKMDGDNDGIPCEQQF